MLWAQWFVLVATCITIPFHIAGQIINTQKSLVVKQKTPLAATVSILTTLFAAYLWYAAGCFSLIF